MVKFNFTHSKLRKQPFFVKHLIGKCQISKSRGARPPCPIPTPMLRSNNSFPVSCPEFRPLGIRQKVSLLKLSYTRNAHDVIHVCDRKHAYDVINAYEKTNVYDICKYAQCNKSVDKIKCVRCT